jgi:hypothetical protein
MLEVFAQSRPKTNPLLKVLLSKWAGWYSYGPR